MRNLYLIMTLLVVTILQSCTRPTFQEEILGSKSAINIKLSTKALELAGTSVQAVRIIAYHKGKNKILLNATGLTDNSTIAGEGSFMISLPTGEYSFYAIVNEPTNLTTVLQGITSMADLDLIKIQPDAPFTESTVMLSKKLDATITVDANKKVLVNGAEVPLSIELERVYTKVSLKINKQTVNPADKFEITKVDFVQSPSYSYLNAKDYDGGSFISRELFKGSVEFETNGTKEVIVSDITTSSEPSNIFAEYLLPDADKGNHDKAAYFGIFAKYTSEGSSVAHEVYYKIPVGDYKGTNAVDGTGHDYNLRRNTHYAFDVKITKMGAKDAIDIKYTVEPWKSEWLDVTIDGDPFLDISNVEVNVYDAAATRIYFYSNMPDVTLNPMLLNGTQSVSVNTLFENLAGMGAKNFTYTYNTATQRGEGYLDLINLHTDNVVSDNRLLYLKSAKLVREITATTCISSEVAKKNQQPYVGTFHRATERGERIISWALPEDSKWRVEIVTSSAIDKVTADAKVYSDATHLRIDRLASPNHSQLYTLDPPKAEGAYVTQDASITKLEGQGRLYFRVGWASTIGYTDHRFAKIKVTTSTDDFATSSEQYLYCRQGENPVPILSNTTVFSCYNISTPEVFVDYPTKTGYLYQWNRAQPWAVTGTVNNYTKGVDETTGDWANSKSPDYEYKIYDEQTYICPAKYAYPDATAVAVMEGALKNAMYQWGYYADGFFDRRAVTENIVRGISGEVATAGGLFFSDKTAVAILLPSATWRDYQGLINNKVGHQQLGTIGHYWSTVEGAWPDPSGTTSPAPVSRALHLTTLAYPDSYMESLNKASAASVRCMRLIGKTVFFDANGGVSTPRSITIKSGNITFPAGPVHRDKMFGFTKWTATRGGTGSSYSAGDVVDIEMVGDKTWYAQYAKVGYLIDGKTMLIASLKTTVKWTQASSHCNSLNTGTETGWRLPTYTESQLFYAADAALFDSSMYWTSSVIGTNHVVFLSSLDFEHAPGDDTSSNVRCVKVL